ncbi:WD40-repeat-containing domain protein [Trichophaea hybrida]|nr:WD40-repeat-containing domain protein [Trichophaea hybrida]
MNLRVIRSWSGFNEPKAPTTVSARTQGATIFFSFVKFPGILTSEVDGRVIESCVPLEVQYACRYWVDHLQRSSIELCACDNMLLHDLVQNFLDQCFFHWLEALSLIGSVPDGVEMVERFEFLPKPHAMANCNLLAIAHDATRFLLSFKVVIEIAPLQVYSSALLFSLSASIVRNQFWHCIPRWIEHAPTVQLWDPKTGVSLGTLDRHRDSDSVAYAFSPDGNFLASSWGKMVQLWDPITGVSQRTLNGSDWAKSVTFSPNALCGTHNGGSSKGFNVVVAFSPDSKFFAFTLSNNTIRLWDSATGAFCGTLDCESNWVTMLAFSPDSKLLVSALFRATVLVWDLATGALCGTLKGNFDSVQAVASSPDCKLLASASFDKTVQLWDPATGALYRTLQGHSDCVTAVAFSLNGKSLASCWRPEALNVGESDRLPEPSLKVHTIGESCFVKLWDLTTGALYGTLQGHSDGVTAVAFSPNSKSLASASFDKTVQLWGLTARAFSSRGTLEGHSSTVRFVAFSPDSKFFVSAFWGGAIQIWDPTTRVLRKTLKCHPSGLGEVVVSPNSKLLAFTFNKTVQLWDLTTGASYGTLDAFSNFNAVKFSPDSKLLATVKLVASGYFDETVRVWDQATGASRALRSQSSWVTRLAFSPDGKLLVGSGNSANDFQPCDVGAGHVWLWDVGTGQVIQEFNAGHDFHHLLFSRSGRSLETDRGVIDLDFIVDWDDQRLTSPYLWNVRIKIGYFSGHGKSSGFLSASALALFTLWSISSRWGFLRVKLHLYNLILTRFHLFYGNTITEGAKI